MISYKEAKKARTKEANARVDNKNPLFNKINADLGLLLGDDEGSKMAGKSTRAFSASEREKRKEELEKWKKEKYGMN